MEKEQATLQMDDGYRPAFERMMNELGIEDNKQAYLMLASYGFLINTPATDFNKKYTVIRVSYLGVEDRALLAALAMEHGSHEPPSMAVAYQLAERYANCGMQLISELMDSPKGFARAFREAVDQERGTWQASTAAAAEAVGIGVELPE